MRSMPMFVDNSVIQQLQTYELVLYADRSWRRILPHIIKRQTNNMSKANLATTPVHSAQAQRGRRSLETILARTSWSVWSQQPPNISLKSEAAGTSGSKCMTDQEIDGSSASSHRRNDGRVPEVAGITTGCYYTMGQRCHVVCLYLDPDGGVQRHRVEVEDSNLCRRESNLCTEDHPRFWHVTE